MEYLYQNHNNVEFTQTFEDFALKTWKRETQLGWLRIDSNTTRKPDWHTGTSGILLNGGRERCRSSQFPPTCASQGDDMVIGSRDWKQLSYLPSNWPSSVVRPRWPLPRASSALPRSVCPLTGSASLVLPRRRRTLWHSIIIGPRRCWQLVDTLQWLAAALRVWSARSTGPRCPVDSHLSVARCWPWSLH